MTEIMVDNFFLVYMVSCSIDILNENQRCYICYGAPHEKTCLWEFANNKGVDQPEYLRRLINALLFTFYKVSYLGLLLVKFRFSS